jgi:Fe-S-cluster containining protein
MSASAEIKTDPVFRCTQCGECCKGYGGTYVSQKEISQISAYLRVDAKDFMQNYCQFSGGRPVLAQAENGYCIFWDKICTIHPVKPEMCRQWPYIRSILIDLDNWRMMASTCPGMRRDASPDQILQAVNANLARRGRDS